MMGLLMMCASTEASSATSQGALDGVDFSSMNVMRMAEILHEERGGQIVL